ncbi:hypothetical protein C8J56DRAFT_885533 [Mycena floridula]|nr:hypothetical protein C8J56DRAFT_885533 [Mycena floridula]
MTSKETVAALVKLISHSAQLALAEYEDTGVDLPSLTSQGSHPLDSAQDTLSLRKQIRILEGACEQLCSMLAPPVHTMVNSSQTASEAKITDILSENPAGLHMSKLSKIVKMDPGELDRILLQDMSSRKYYNGADKSAPILKTVGFHGTYFEWIQLDPQLKKVTLAFNLKASESISLLSYYFVRLSIVRSLALAV